MANCNWGSSLRPAPWSSPSQLKLYTQRVNQDSVRSVEGGPLGSWSWTEWRWQRNLRLGGDHHGTVGYIVGD